MEREPAPTWRVMTWNLWWQFGPWEARQPAIEETLAATEADVIGLQEVYAVDGDGPLDGDQAERLAAALGYGMARSVADDGTPDRFGNAVLSRWPIRSSETIRLVDADGAVGLRSALLVDLDTPHGVQLVVCTHLDWRYDQSALRQAQLQQICDAVAEWDAEVTVVLGDLNATPDSDEVRRLTGLAPPYVAGLVFTDAWATAGAGPGFTWERSNPHSPDAQWPRRRLDQILIAWPRPKPLGNAVAAHLTGGADDPRPDVCGSDHWAVVADLDARRFT